MASEHLPVDDTEKRAIATAARERLGAVPRRFTVEEAVRLFVAVLENEWPGCIRDGLAVTAPVAVEALRRALQEATDEGA